MAAYHTVHNHAMTFPFTIKWRIRGKGIFRVVRGKKFARIYRRSKINNIAKGSGAYPQSINAIARDQDN